MRLEKVGAELLECIFKKLCLADIGQFELAKCDGNAEVNVSHAAPGRLEAACPCLRVVSSDALFVCAPFVFVCVLLFELLPRVSRICTSLTATIRWIERKSVGL